MFAVDDILVSDDVLEAPFTCNLGACRGACCVQGESGAPLEPDERYELERVLPHVRTELRNEALDVIARHGVWVEEAPGHFATTCVGDAECVFVVYEGAVAKCALQRAYQEGRIDFEKPVSCHLFPLRVEDWGGTTVINYEQIEACRPAVKHGQRLGVHLPDFLQRPLVRRFGAPWYERFRTACKERIDALSQGAGANATV